MITGIAYNGGVFLAIGSLGSMLKSSNGINWNYTGSNMPIVDYESFAIYYQLNNLSLSYLGYYATVSSYKGTFLAAGLDGIIVQSGNTWNSTTLNASQTTSNGFIFSYNQQVDVPYHIQVSTNLLHWENLYSGIGCGQPTNFTYSASGNSPARFFRLVSP